MSLPEGSEATVASEESVPEQKQSLSDEILALMQGQEPVEAEEEKEEETHPEIPEPPAEEEETEEKEEEPAPAIARGEEWPKSAKKRVAEQTETINRERSGRQKAESELEKLQGRIQQLEGELQDQSRPRPTSKDPLADVFDLDGLRKAEGHFRNAKEAATRALDENPGLDEIELPIGKDKTKMFSRRELSDMRIDADHALSKLIPERRQLLAQRGQADAMAQKIYPQLTEESGEWTGFVQQTLAQFPDLGRVPDIAIWLGHALYGRQIRLNELTKELDKGGKPASPNGESSTANEIMAASRTAFKKAPALSTGRVPSQSTPRRGADVEVARKAMRANPGSDEALENFIDAKLFRSPSRGYRKI